MKSSLKKEIIDMLNKEEFKGRTILTIKTKPITNVRHKGVEINEGYEYELNGALPELAFGIANFAKELPNQGFGDGSDKEFIKLINLYFKKK